MEVVKDDLRETKSRRQRVPGRRCKNCGTAIYRDNLTGICKTNPECERENKEISEGFRREIAEENRKRRYPNRKCKNCGTGIYRNNPTGICITNPECERENEELIEQDRREGKRTKAHL